jgi:formate dehydrogenase subunit gamma
VGQPQPGQLEAWLDHGVGPGGARSYLRKIQSRLHWVPREALSLASDHYEVSYASLLEEVTLSPYFSLEPRGERVVELCRGLACRDAGSDAIVAHLEALSGLKLGETSPDGALSLLGIPCMGHCAIGPNARLQGRFCHNLTPETAASLLQRPVKEG